MFSDRHLENPRGISDENLRDKLRRDYSKYRSRFGLLASDNGGFIQEPSKIGNQHPPKQERVALARMIEMLPDAIDVYDFALWEAKRKGPEAVKKLRRLGREQFSALFDRGMRRMQENGGVHPRRLPRGNLDLVDIELEILSGADAERGRSPAS